MNEYSNVIKLISILILFLFSVFAASIASTAPPEDDWLDDWINEQSSNVPKDSALDHDPTPEEIDAEIDKALDGVDLDDPTAEPTEPSSEADTSDIDEWIDEQSSTVPEESALDYDPTPEEIDAEIDEALDGLDLDEADAEADAPGGNGDNIEIEGVRNQMCTLNPTNPSVSIGPSSPTGAASGPAQAITPTVPGTIHRPDMPAELWERQAAAALASMLESDSEGFNKALYKNTLDTIDNMHTDPDTLARDKQYSEWDLRVANDEFERQARYAAFDQTTSLNRKRQMASTASRRFAENAGADGVWTDEEYEEYNRLYVEEMELWEFTPEEEAQMQQYTERRDKVIEIIRANAYNDPMLSDEAIAERAQTVKMFDAATKTWRSVLFVGQTVNWVGSDMYQQRELWIEADLIMKHAETYMRKKGISDEDKAMAKDVYNAAQLAQAAAEDAIAVDIGVVLAGTSADFALLGVGGILGKVSSKIDKGIRSIWGRLFTKTPKPGTVPAAGTSGTASAASAAESSVDDIISQIRQLTPDEQVAHLSSLSEAQRTQVLTKLTPAEREAYVAASARQQIGQGLDAGLTESQVVGDDVLSAPAVSAGEHLRITLTPELLQKFETPGVNLTRQELLLKADLLRSGWRPGQPFPTSTATATGRPTGSITRQVAEGETIIETAGSSGTAVRTGPGSTQRLNTGPGETQSIRTGPGDTQRLNTGPGETQSIRTGPGDTQRLPTGPGDTQRISTEASQAVGVGTKPASPRKPMDPVPLIELGVKTAKALLTGSEEKSFVTSQSTTVRLVKARQAVMEGGEHKAEAVTSATIRIDFGGDPLVAEGEDTGYDEDPIIITTGADGNAEFYLPPEWIEEMLERALKDMSTPGRAGNTGEILPETETTTGGRGRESGQEVEETIGPSSGKKTGAKPKTGGTIPETESTTPKTGESTSTGTPIDLGIPQEITINTTPMDGTLIHLPEGADPKELLHSGLQLLTRTAIDLDGTPVIVLSYPQHMGPQVAKWIEDSTGIALAEPDYCRIIEGTNDDPYFSSKSTWGQGYDDQWGLKRVGFTDAKNSAWNLITSDPKPVVVAVIDTGLDWNHRDISWDNIWQNSGEIPDNRIDDDKNGYVDDRIGWDFTRNTNSPWDRSGHGTFVAGIIAATRDNGIGIAGINPSAEIMVLKAMNNFGQTRASFLIEAILYAVNNGAKVINMSVGGANMTQAEQLALDYAFSNGTVVVVASGNEGADVTNMGPAGMEHVITVAATDTNDKRATFSNWGPGVDIAAPGVDILSLRARRTDLMLGLPEVKYEAGQSYVGEDKRYYRSGGTSFAAPIVAGVASLLASNNPNLSNEQIERMLLYSAKDIEVPGWDQYSGHGLVDASAALMADPDLFIQARIDKIEVISKRGEPYVRVWGLANADKFARAWIDLGQGENPATWKKVSSDLTASVKDGTLAELDAQHFAGAKQWTLRLVVEHKNGQKRIFWYRVNLG